MYADILEGKKGYFIWNLSAFGRDVVSGLRNLLNNSACNILAIKTYDEKRNFISQDQFHQVKAGVADWDDVLVGVWGYHYGHDTWGELEVARRHYVDWGAHFLILNVEDPAIERNPHTAVQWESGLAWLRQELPDASIYFCSHAQPGYHATQPYWQATKYGLIHQPMIYHTAMQMEPERSVDVSVNSYDAYHLLTNPENGSRLPWSAAGAAYGERGFPIRYEDIVTWGHTALERGATSLIWWDGDVAQHDPDILAGIRDCDMAHTQRNGSTE